MLGRCKIINGDCREVIPSLGKKYDFIFADPPFNIGHPYKGFKDTVPVEDYIHFLEEWVGQCWNHCNGVLCLHGPDGLAAAYLELSCHFNMMRVAWINWHYRFGQCGRSNWIDARCHCLIFTNRNDYTWNPDSVLVDSDRVAYGDKRIGDHARGGKRLPGTIWGVPSDGPYWGRVTKTNKERREGHPNQLPELYLARLIKAYTNPGDLILDPFAGSGTSAVVARALGRDVITIDISEENCASVRERIKKGAVRV